MQEYLLNFFIWWYAIQAKNMLYRVRRWELFLLMYTNTLPMLRNLNQPLFQDYSRIGKAIGFVIRLIWVILGGTVVLLLMIPLLALVLVYALLPILAIGQILLALLLSVPV